jgi:ribonuclease T
MSEIANRFRGFLPVVIDVETGGFNSDTDALLEIAASILRMDEDGRIYRAETTSCHVEPFPGANIEDAALEFTGIRLDHPFRMALEEKEALQKIFQPVREEVRATGCQRAILVGHNPAFDLGFLNAAVGRCRIKRSPFHPFTTFDTATLAGLAFGQTVLARAARAAGINWDADQAHSAAYDTERTADLFCIIVNRWSELLGEPVLSHVE